MQNIRGLEQFKNEGGGRAGTRARYNFFWLEAKILVGNYYLQLHIGTKQLSPVTITLYLLAAYYLLLATY